MKKNKNIFHARNRTANIRGRISAQSNIGNRRLEGQYELEPCSQDDRDVRTPTWALGQG